MYRLGHSNTGSAVFNPALHSFYCTVVNHGQQKHPITEACTPLGELQDTASLIKKFKCKNQQETNTGEGPKKQ